MNSPLGASYLLAACFVCFSAGNLWPATPPKVVTFSPPEVARGGSFKIDIVPPPANPANAAARLFRNGVSVDAQVAYPFVTVPNEPPLKLGNYQVTVELDKVPYFGAIRIRPPGTGEVKLDKFYPNYTDTTETIWIKGKTDQEPPHPLRTVSLTLRGFGFLNDTQNDNTIWINGERQSIQWDGDCSEDAKKKDGAVHWVIHGKVVSFEQIDLCQVAVPASGVLRVMAGYGDTPGDPQVFTVYWMGTAKVALIAFAITAALAGLVFWLLSLTKRTYQIAGKDYKLSLLFLDKETDTYSLSKFQFYLWTLAALFTYAYLYISKVFIQSGSWPDIPGTLPGIIGIGAGTAIGSQVVTAANGAKGAGEEKPGFLDFITSGGVVAADRVQMFLWTIFGVGAFCVGVLKNAPGSITEIAPVPDGMMYLMGLSSAGYLGGKMARKPGPVITELTVTPGQSDQTLANAASAAVILPDFSQPSLVAATNLNTLPKVANPSAQKAIGAFGNAIKAAGAVHTTSDLANLISGLAGFRRECEAAAAATAADFSATPAKATSQEAAAAQQAAAFLQDFSGDATQAIAAAAAPSMDSAGSSGSVPRVIELRGTGLSPDGTFEIGHADLPFRMLINKDGQNAPDVVSRQDGGNFANVLRFTIDPARLDSTDLAQYQAWFGADAKWVATLTNPDGQKADQSFSLPPATTTPQKA